MPTQNDPLNKSVFQQSRLIKNLDAIFRDRFPDATSQINQKGICRSISLGYANQLFISEEKGTSFLQMLQELGQPRESGGQKKAEDYLSHLYQDIDAMKTAIRYTPKKTKEYKDLMSQLREKHEELALIENFFLLYAQKNPSDPNALYLSNIRDEYYKITGLDNYARCAFLVNSDRQIESFFTPGHEASPFVANGIYELCTHNHSMLVQVDKDSGLKLFDPNQGWLTEEEVKTFFKSHSNLPEISNLYKFNQDTYFIEVHALSPIETKNDSYHQPIAPVTEEQKNIVIAKIKAAQEAFKNQIQSNDNHINIDSMISAGKNGGTALHGAVIRNQKYLIEVLLSIPGIDVNHADIDGRTALSYALQYNDREAAILLLKAGADVNQPNRDGEAPLAWALQHNDKEMAILLLEAGACDNQSNRNAEDVLSWALTNVNRDTTLTWALKNNHSKTSRFLLKAGARVDDSNIDGNTPLAWALQHNDREVAILLLKAGAGVNQPNRDGETPLTWALQHNDKEMAELLLKAGARVNQLNRDGETLLGLAIKQKKDKNLIELLFEQGAEYKKSTGELIRRYVFASYVLNEEHMRKNFLNIKIQDGGRFAKLLNRLKDANIESINLTKDTGKELFLHLAAYGAPTDLELLMKMQSPSITDLKETCNRIQDEKGDNALDYAVNANNTPMQTYLQGIGVIDRKQIVEDFLNTKTQDGGKFAQLLNQLNNANNENVNLMKDRGKQLFLHLAAYGSLTDLELLITMQSPSLTDHKEIFDHVQDEKRANALHYAVSAGNNSIVEYLLDKRVNVLSEDQEQAIPLYRAAEKGHEAILRTLLSYADYNDQHIFMALSLALQYGKIECARALLGDFSQDEHNNRSIQVSNLSIDGTPILLLTSLSGSKESVEFLLKAGADINGQYMHPVTDMNLEPFYMQGQTPLLVAIEQDNLELVNDLLDAGADVDLAYTNGQTPLLVAINKGSLEIVKELLDAGADVDIQGRDGETPRSLADNPAKMAVMLPEYSEKMANMIKNTHPLKRLRASLYTLSKAHEDKIYSRLTKLHHIDLDNKDNGDDRLLFHMAKIGAIRAFDWLMENSSRMIGIMPPHEIEDDINRPDEHGHTALYYAVQQKQVEMVKHILDQYKPILTPEDHKILMPLNSEHSIINAALTEYIHTRSKSYPVWQLISSIFGGESDSAINKKDQRGNSNKL